MQNKLKTYNNIHLHTTLIHKKGSQHLVSNHRPVSLTSTPVKVMESIVKTNVLEHLASL